MAKATGKQPSRRSKPAIDLLAFKRHVRFTSRQWELVRKMAAADLVEPAAFLRRLVMREAERRGLLPAGALPMG